MREIKFRGWSKEYQKMFDYDLLKKASDGMVEASQKLINQRGIDSIPVKKGLFIPTEDEDMVLMQYTGIKDLEDNEIYEQDVVKLKLLYPNEKLEELDGTCGVVIMLEGQWVIEFSGTAIPLWSEEYTCKIFGKVYDMD